MKKLLLVGALVFTASAAFAVTPSSTHAMDMLAVIDCTVFGCEEGCTSGSDCKLHEK